MATGMKLYDLIFKRAVQKPNRFDNWERYYRGLPVYEISPIVKLTYGECEKLINSASELFKLPHECLWMEWQSYVYGTDQTFLCGARLQNCDESLCMVEMFQYTDKQVGDFPIGLFAYGSQCFVRMNGEKIEFSEGVPGGFDEIRKTLDVHSPISTFIMRGEKDSPCGAAPEFSLWVTPIVACMMLNCRNIVTEDVKQDKFHQKVKGEREHRPFCTYKILKLEVPKRMAERNGDDVEGSGPGEPKVRFHLCRGHFKNLKHERYNEKGWHWWPAHWKGNIKLGRVDKSYKLEAATA